MRPWTAIALGWAALGCDGCWVNPPDGGTGCEIEVEWGRVVSQTFLAYKDGDRVEITLGFQGFRFISSAARLRGTDASRASFQFDVEVEGESPYAQPGGTVDLRSSGDGSSMSEEILVFFNDIPMAQLVGRSARIATTARADRCSGRSEVSVVLVDEDRCIQDADGGRSCGDGGS